MSKHIDAGAFLASPRARRLIHKLKLDGRRISGSGPRGRIVEKDVLSLPPISPTETTTMRRMIASRTSESFSTIPHFYLRAELDATNLLLRRERIQSELGVKLTVTDFLLQAMAQSLRDCPWANTIWINDALSSLSVGDVGLVVGLDDGLIVPVIRESDLQDLCLLSKRRTELILAARSGRLLSDATHGGAISLSNLGTNGVDEFQAIIMPGQSSMLASGCIRKRPIVVAGELCARPTLRLCLSVDHRVMDGGPAGRFLESIINKLEKE